MKDALREIICEALQTDECLGHCNYPYCMQVNKVADRLTENNVVLMPHKVGDTVYYITGIHGKLAKPARIDEIYFNGIDFGYSLVTGNNVYFDMPATDVFDSEEAAMKEINK